MEKKPLFCKDNIPLIVMIIGLIFAANGGLLILKHFIFMQNAEYTTGIITKVKENTTSDDSEYYTIYVRYTVDGKEYNSKYTDQHYSSANVAGGTASFYYNTKNPTWIEEITSEKEFYVTFSILTAIGLIAAAVGFVLMKRKKKKNQIEE